MILRPAEMKSFTHIADLDVSDIIKIRTHQESFQLICPCRRDLKGKDADGLQHIMAAESFQTEQFSYI